jgi:hypothetical protein
MEDTPMPPKNSSFFNGIPPLPLDSHASGYDQFLKGDTWA